MEEKLVDKIVKNYSSLIDKLEIYSNSEKNSEDKSLKELASYIASIIKNTDFENKILKNDLDNYYKKDKGLMNVLVKRNVNIVSSALNESKVEILKLRLAQISNEIYHYLEDKNNLNIKNVNIKKICTNFQIFLKKNDIDLSNIEKGLSEYSLNYINKNILGDEINKFIDFMSINGFNKNSADINLYKDFIHFFEKNEIMKNMLDLKETLTQDILRYPQNIKVFKEDDNKKIEKEKSYRLFFVEKNGYLYSQFHARKNVIDNIGNKYKKYIKENKTLDKAISLSIGINLDEREKAEYYKSEEKAIEFKDYIFLYDKLNKEKEYKEINDEE
ncbi:MAG: hypothetical protein ACI4ON_01030 [Clostridia bacterium]